MNSSVKATCRVCNGSFPADQFKLHYKFKKMVCPNCFSGRTQREEEKKKAVEKETPKPAGWDHEDEYLEKVLKSKERNEKAKFEKIPGTHQVKCTCKSCNYSFKYDPFRKLPRTCPYCNNDIPKLRTFSLL